MKFLVFSLILMAGFQASADCLKEAEKAALEKASLKYKIAQENLKAKYITGESLDSDTNSDGSLYVSRSYEVFEIKNKKSDRVVVTYSVSMETITDNATNALVECSISDIQKYEE